MPLDVAVTIATSRKVVVDSVTGKIELEDGDSVKAAANASFQGALEGVPAAEINAQQSSAESAKVAAVAFEPLESTVGAPVDPASKANKRLSAETLFAFALPEPVLKKAGEDLKKDSLEEAPLASQNSNSSTLLWMLVCLFPLLLLIGISYYYFEIL